MATYDPAGSHPLYDDYIYDDYIDESGMVYDAHGA